MCDRFQSMQSGGAGYNEKGKGLPSLLGHTRRGCPLAAALFRCITRRDASACATALGAEVRRRSGWSYSRPTSFMRQLPRWYLPLDSGWRRGGHEAEQVGTRDGIGHIPSRVSNFDLPLPKVEIRLPDIPYSSTRFTLR